MTFHIESFNSSMIRRVLFALAFFLPTLICFPRPAVAQVSDPCTPNYARVSRMQGLLHWEHFPLRVAFAPVPDNVQNKDACQQAVLAGFTQWVEATHGLVRYTVVTQPKRADILVSFLSDTTVPGQGAAVGYTSMTFCGMTLHYAEMQLATGGTAPGDLQAVAAHEFGHALGIDGHSDDPNDIMYPSTLRMSAEDGTPLASPQHPVTARDLNTLKVCYLGLFAPHLAALPGTALGHGRIGAALLGARRAAPHSLPARSHAHG